MQFRRLILAALFLGTTFGLSAQDVHYTLHDMSPLWLNPAHTGAFNGTIRASGHYRANWLGTNGINSPNLALDATLPFAFRKNDWIGVGANMIMDQANGPAADVVRRTFNFSAAYHLSLNKQRTSVLTLGAQYGAVTIGVNSVGGCVDGTQEVNTSLGLGGQGQAGQCENFAMADRDADGPRDNYTDINAGLMFRTILDVKKHNTLEMGLSMLHITADDYTTFVGDSASASIPDPDVGGSNTVESREVGRTLHAHARANFEVSENIRFMPTAFFQSSRSNSTVSVQAWAGLELKNDMLFKFGLGYRTADAGKILLGFEKDRLQIAASWDVVLSQQATILSESDGTNAVEIAANYIFNIYKKPEPKPSILCPQI